MLDAASPIVQVVVSAPPDNEWLKLIASLGIGVIVGVVLGVLSALFLEPMKFKNCERFRPMRLVNLSTRNLVQSLLH